jgi:hypothetical protein
MRAKLKGGGPDSAPHRQPVLSAGKHDRKTAVQHVGRRTAPLWLREHYRNPASRSGATAFSCKQPRFDAVGPAAGCCCRDIGSHAIVGPSVSRVVDESWCPDGPDPEIPRNAGREEPTAAAATTRLALAWAH